VVSEKIFVCRFQTKEKEETVTLFTDKGEMVGEILVTSSGIKSRDSFIYNR
jgi:hypothetical protein